MADATVPAVVNTTPPVRENRRMPDGDSPLGLRERKKIKTREAIRREAFRLIVLPPMPTWVRFLTPAQPAWGGLAALAVSLLPTWARQLYSWPVLPLTDVMGTGHHSAVSAGMGACDTVVGDAGIVTPARRGPARSKETGMP